MIEQGYMQPDTQSATAADLLDKRGPMALTSVSPDDKVQDAIDLMRKDGISQLPVIEDGKVVGAMRELTAARLLHSHMDPRQIPVREIMARPMPTVDQQVDLDEVYRLLMAGNSGVVITTNNKIRGIVTRIDLVTFWDQPVQTTAD